MEEYDVDSILDMYEESYVPEPSAMAQGGRIPFAKAKSVQKKYQPSGENLTEAQIEGYAKRFNAEKAFKEQKFKSLVDKIFETEDFDNFKAEVTEAQKRFAKKAGKVREGTGIIPAQYIKEFNQAIAAGVDSPEFKNLLRITGRTEEEILKLNELRPGGKPTTKVRSQSSIKYPANYRDPDKELKKETTQKKIKKKRADASAVGKKYASEAELKRFNLINEQKKKLNKFFQENPKALLNTEFGKKIKELMDVRIDKDGKFFQNTRPDDYYIAKAKEGKIFDIFDINKIAKGQRSTKFTSNLNILPGQFNQAFIEGQVNKYFKKGGRLEGQTEILKNVSNYLDNIGVKVDIEDVGRIGGGDPVFFDSKTNRYPHIENTLKKMNIPDELLTEIKPVGEGVTLGANRIPKKLLTKTLGDMAMSLGSPTALLGLNAYLGVDPKESLDRAILGGEVALAPSGIKALTSRLDAIKNPAVRKGIETVAGLRLPGVFTPANVMRAARFAQPLGIATLAGEGLYQLGKLGYEEQQRINAMSPEEKAQYLAEQQELADVSA